MARIVFETPALCEDCGGYNFRVVGVIYNGSLNYSKVKVKCMRCGKIVEEISIEKNRD